MFAITAYWMQVFPMPKKVVKKIQMICRNFLWSGTTKIREKTLVASDKIFYFKTACGLNLTSLLEWNVATVSKMLYNLQAKADKLYVKSMNEYSQRAKTS